jgi:hypothetical protein
VDSLATTELFARIPSTGVRMADASFDCSVSRVPSGSLLRAPPQCFLSSRVTSSEPMGCGHSRSPWYSADLEGSFTGQHNARPWTLSGSTGPAYAYLVDLDHLGSYSAIGAGFANGTVLSSPLFSPDGQHVLLSIGTGSGLRCSRRV